MHTIRGAVEIRQSTPPALPPTRATTFRGSAAFFFEMSNSAPGSGLAAAVPPPLPTTLKVSSAAASMAEPRIRPARPGGADEESPAALGLQLLKIAPYWHDYATHAKARWIGRELLEVYTNEFRDRTKEYYLWAIHSGICTVNGQKAGPRHIIHGNDRLVNRVHRHEPPVTAAPIHILYRNDDEGRLVVVKPGSIPVHSAGRYHHSTLIEMLRHQLGLPKVYTANRLDRLTSGVMVLSTTPQAAKELANDFKQSRVRKFYVARVLGEFPSQRIVCTEPILPVDAQSGVNIVHPLGKPCETIFERVSYHASSDTSVVRCQPVTGRTHQIRVHCQYLGHPIANDPVYGHSIWAEQPAQKMGDEHVDPSLALQAGGTGSTGSAAVDAVIAAVKKQRDGTEDWARWKDEVIFGRLLQESGHEVPAHLPGVNALSAIPADATETREEILSQLGFHMSDNRFMDRVKNDELKGLCPECKVPLLPDPNPESLFIFLHAFKYETDDWSFEDTFPWWAEEDWNDQILRSRKARNQAALKGEDHSIYFHVPDDEQAPAPKRNIVGPSAAKTSTEKQEEMMRTYLDPLAAEGITGSQREEIGVLNQLRTGPDWSRLVDRPLHTDVHSLPTLVPCDMDLALSVFEGLEDVAEADVRRVLQLYRGRYKSDTLLPPRQGWDTVAFLHSGQVLASGGEAATLLLRAWLDGQLRSADQAHMILHHAELPKTLARALLTERHALGKTGARGGKRKNPAAKQKSTPTLMEIVGGVHDLNVQGRPPLLGQAQCEAIEDDLKTLPVSEAALLQRIRDVWTSTVSQSRRDAALNIWINARRARGDEYGEGNRPKPLAGDGTSFKVAFDRGGYMLPSLKPAEVEPLLGETVWPWLNGALKPSDPQVTWPVNLRSAQMTVAFRLAPSWIEVPETWSPEEADELRRLAAEPIDETASADPPPGTIFALLQLPYPKETPGRPTLPPETFGGGTLLRPDRAYTLSALTCLPVAGASRILEPCVGWGRIPTELREALRATWTAAQVYGSDSDPRAVEMATDLLLRAGASRGSDPVQTNVLDATQPGALRAWIRLAESEGIDAALSELPWGQKAMSASELRKFYKDLLPSVVQTLRPGARALFMTVQHGLFDRTLSDFQLTQAGNEPMYNSKPKPRPGMPQPSQAVRLRQEWTLEKTPLALAPASTPAEPAGTIEDPRHPGLAHYASSEADGLGVHAIGFERSPARAQGVRNAEQHGGHRTARSGYTVGIFELRKVRLEPETEA